VCSSGHNSSNSRKAKIRRVDFVHVSLPGQRLAEFVELVLVRNS
jgi:hypothetical protein